MKELYAFVQAENNHKSTLYPIYMISLQFPSDEIDVNLEPDKTKVLVKRQVKRSNFPNFPLIKKMPFNSFIFRTKSWILLRARLLVLWEIMKPPSPRMPTRIVFLKQDCLIHWSRSYQMPVVFHYWNRAK